MNEPASNNGNTSTKMTRPQGGGNGLRGYLERPEVKAKLAEVASAAMRPDDLIRLALMTLSRQPDLAKCSQASVLRALLDAAALGIKPGGLMGRGYLVPRFNKQSRQLECCFDPGWRGLIDVARRTGQIKRIEAHVVYEGDLFRVVYGLETRIEHEPALDGPQDKIVAAYAVAEFKDGSTQLEVLTKKDLDKIRNSSASRGGPWASWPEEMARKSAVRRLCKYLPYDEKLERALEAATDAEADEPMVRDAHFTPDAAPARGGRSKALADKIRGAQTAPDLGELPEGEPGELAPDVDPETGEVVPQMREPGQEG